MRFPRRGLKAEKAASAQAVVEAEAKVALLKQAAAADQEEIARLKQVASSHETEITELKAAVLVAKANCREPSCA